MYKKIFLILAWLCALEHWQDGTAAAAAVRSLPGLTANTLAANDDGSSATTVNIGFSVNFFSVKQNTVWVNNNGNITFTSALFNYTPLGIATTVNQPMIAPFFADVDTRGTGSGLTQWGQSTLCGRKVFGVNWIKVGYFASQVDKLNSFQLLLIERSDVAPGDFDIEMNYDQIQWETGGASGGSGGLGGTSVEAGYTNGLSGAARKSFQFPGSQVNGALIDGGPLALVSNRLNAATPGRYHFQVRNGQVTTGTQKAEDISSQIRPYFPSPYGYHPGRKTYNGFLTIRRQAITTTPAANVDGCLDIVNTQPQAAKTGVAILFTQLPPGVTLANPTGLTSKGYAYISLPNNTLGPGNLVRTMVAFRNPNRRPLGSYYQGNGFFLQILAGPFNPKDF